MTNDGKRKLHWAASSIEAEDRRAALQDVRAARRRLGNFTLRFMMEAVYGDEYTKEVLGESGGNILMRDIKVETTAENGGMKTTINEKQLQGIVEEAHRGKSKKQIAGSNAKARKIMKGLADFSEEERETIMKFMKKMGG